MSVDKTHEEGAMRSVRSGRLVRLFTDEERNALMTALCRAAGATDESDNAKLYPYIEETPKTSMVSELVDELHRLGYRIQPNIPVRHEGAKPRSCL